LGNAQGEKQKNERKWFYFGAVALTVFSKYKLILPLLSKIAVPVISMLASILAYAWAMRSWGIAIGLVVMIFIHEMGHVIAAKQKNLPVSAPIFIPFLGAFIALKNNPRDAVTEAHVALGGPLLGSLGAMATYLIGVAMDSTILIVVAYFGFFINLLNLLPIHPLDGGRIVTAVSRWFWVIGLIGGLVVIYYLKSIIFFILWAIFAWDLYVKYVKKRKKGTFNLPFQIKIPIEYLRMQGVFVPGEQHQRELEFVTHSDRNRKQTVEVYWDSVGVRDQVTLSGQYLIRRVSVNQVKHVLDETGTLTHVVAHCEISGFPFENDRYYEVPSALRMRFGMIYLGLAVALGFMMYTIQSMHLPGI
jgi:Zn-dependent protease